jgi:hypothetical protein
MHRYQGNILAGAFLAPLVAGSVEGQALAVDQAKKREE